MKLYERIENNNFDEIDRNRAIELIEGGNGHLVYNENYFKLQKENEELGISNKYTIHLTDKQYNVVIENAQNDINQKWIQKVKDKIKEEKMPLTIAGGIRNKKILEYGISLGRMQVLQELIGEREENKNEIN
jgi:imidazole glycerol phosphate synthase subunit HisF